MGNYVHRAAQGDAPLYRGVSPLRHEGYEYSVPYSTPGPARRYAGKQGYVEVCHPTWRRLDEAVDGPSAELVETIAQIIRTVDGNHTMGAAELAEAIADRLSMSATREMENAFVRVYAVIQGLGDALPANAATRNAMIWRGVDAALNVKPE